MDCKARKLSENERASTINPKNEIANQRNTGATKEENVNPKAFKSAWVN